MDHTIPSTLPKKGRSSRNTALATGSLEVAVATGKTRGDVEIGVKVLIYVFT